MYVSVWRFLNFSVAYTLVGILLSILISQMGLLIKLQVLFIYFAFMSSVRYIFSQSVGYLYVSFLILCVNQQNSLLMKSEFFF